MNKNSTFYIIFGAVFSAYVIGIHYAGIWLGQVIRDIFSIIY